MFISGNRLISHCGRLPVLASGSTLLCVLLMVTFAKAGASQFLAPSEFSRVQTGDLVKVDYTARKESGEPVRSTDEKITKEILARSGRYAEVMTGSGPEDIWAGHSASLPGIAEAVIGMAPGESKQVTLPPEKAFGAADPKKKREFPCKRSMPQNIQLSPDEYVQRFHSFPLAGMELQITPYFIAVITDVSEKSARLECRPRDGEHREEEFGSVDIKLTDDAIEMTLHPRLGAPFVMDGRRGSIVATDGNVFTVDFNDPLAGQNIVLEVRVVSLKKGSELDSLQIPWQEDHDAGLARAKQEGKPAIIVLYADWCGYCKRLFGETFQDPRIKALDDKFIWIKVNSDSEPGFKNIYSQAGFPLTVIINSDGKEIDRIDGFRDGPAFRDELIKVFLPGFLVTRRDE